MTVNLPNDIGEIVDLFYAVREAIFKHVGYVENWRVFPLDDQRGKFWCVDAAEREFCFYADTEENLHDDAKGHYHGGPIYTQRHLKKWVFRGEKLTMVIVDTQRDGNIFCMLFDNDKERPAPERS